MGNSSNKITNLGYKSGEIKQGKYAIAIGSHAGSIDQGTYSIAIGNNAGYYKMTLYPHCFYIDQNMQLKSFDFYACIEKAHPYIERFKIEGMIGTESINFFNDATINGVIDFNIFFKSTLISRLSNTWPENPFPQLYDQLCTK